MWRLRNDVFVLLQTLLELTIPVTNRVSIVLGLGILAFLGALSVGTGGADWTFASAFLESDIVSYRGDPLRLVIDMSNLFLFSKSNEKHQPDNELKRMKCSHRQGLHASPFGRRTLVAGDGAGGS